MPRQLRLEYAGAIYHVMSRGDRRERIYLDAVDRHDFIKTLAEACQKTGWQVHAYCLMPKRSATHATTSPGPHGRSATSAMLQFGHKTRWDRGKSARRLRRHLGEKYDAKKVRNT